MSASATSAHRTSKWIRELSEDTATSARTKSVNLATEPRSAGVIYRALGVLAGVLDSAVRDGRIPPNVARGAQNLPPKQSQKPTALTSAPDEIARLAAVWRRSWGVRRSMAARSSAVVNQEFTPSWVFARRRCLPCRSVKTRSSGALAATELFEWILEECGDRDKPALPVLRCAEHDLCSECWDTSLPR